MVKAIVHGQVVTSERAIPDGVVVIESERLAAVGEAGQVAIPAGAEVFDARGRAVVPGFIDAHTHGGDGVDYMGANPEQVAHVLAWEASKGVTGLLPTLASSSLEDLLRDVKMLVGVMQDPPPGARILGIHLEGPYINPAKRGAQPQAAIRPPNIPEMEQVLAAGQGAVRIVTLAPELPGALDLVRYLVERGVVASVGHSNATFKEVIAAAEAGLSRAAHLFNGMSGFDHRSPGAVGAILARDDITAEIILDGIHVAPGAVEVALRSKGLEEIVLITDSNQAAGQPEGVYVRPGNRRIVVKDGAARLENGSLAGSILTMDRAVANANRFLGLPLTEAAYLAAAGPARSLGIDEQKGSLAPGKDADLVLLSEDGSPWMTWVGGQVVYAAA